MIVVSSGDHRPTPTRRDQHTRHFGIANPPGMGTSDGTSLGSFENLRTVLEFNKHEINRKFIHVVVRSFELQITHRTVSEMLCSTPPISVRTDNVPKGVFSNCHIRKVTGSTSTILGAMHSVAPMHNSSLANHTVRGIERRAACRKFGPYHTI